MNNKNWLEGLTAEPEYKYTPEWYQAQREAYAAWVMRTYYDQNWKPVVKTIAEYWREFRAERDKPCPHKHR